MATVLLIEDQTALRLVIGINLALAGIDLLEAENGAAGLALARTAKPDVIVLDIRQGFEATPKEAYSFWCECGCRERLTVRLRKFDASKGSRSYYKVTGTERHRAVRRAARAA